MTNKKRIKSSDKNIKKFFNTQKRKDALQNNTNDLEKLEDLNHIIKEKEESNKFKSK